MTMSKRSRVVFGSIFLLLLLMLSFPTTHTQAQQGIRGPTTGLFWIPSAFQLMFGDVTTSDVYLQKNGASVLGVSGNLGGAGAVANTTITPAGPFAWGRVTMSGTTATVTFPQAFTNVPVCVTGDTTAATAVKSAPTATTLVLTAGATDVVMYLCFGNPN